MTSIFRRRKKRRWTDADVGHALEVAEQWLDAHPGARVWFACSAAEKDEVRARYGDRVAVVPVYPERRNG